MKMILTNQHQHLKMDGNEQGAEVRHSKRTGIYAIRTMSFAFTRPPPAPFEGDEFEIIDIPLWGMKWFRLIVV